MEATGKTSIRDVAEVTNISRKYLIDIILFLSLTISAALVGTWFVTSNTVKKFNFYQTTFAPAVMVACGHGFILPNPIPKEMVAFLELRSQSFSCESISANQKPALPDTFQVAHRNLMLTVATWWRVLGISWENLSTLYGLVFGLTAGFAYLLFRTAIRPPIALALTCIFILSPPQLFNLPHLRDYIKAPFMLAAIVMIAWLLKGSMRRDVAIWGIVVTGLTLGFGIGYRIDLIVLVPLLTTVILFMQPGSWVTNLKPRFITTLVFLVCFFVAASPTLLGIRGETNMAHVIVLGLMEEFDQKIGLSSAYYGLGYHYLDLYSHTVISSFAHASGYAGQTIVYPSSQYGASGLSYLIEVYKNFPADIAARYFASVWRILHLPVEAPVIFEDLYFFYDDLRPQWLMNLTHHRAWEVVLFAVISMSAALIACKSFKLLISVFLVVLYLCGYPFLQFGVRHYFFLQVIGLWIFGLSFQYFLLDPIWNWYQRKNFASNSGFQRQDKQLWISRGLRSLAAVGLVFGLPMALLGLLRVYQSNHLGTVFAAYATSPTMNIATRKAERDGGWKILQLSDAAGDNTSSTPSIKTIPLVATFDSGKCKRDTVQVRFKYRSADPTYDFSHTRSLGIDGNTRIFFPAFFQADLSAFSGIEMPAEEFGCLVSLERLAVAPPLSIPLTVTMPQNWMDLPRYRTFR